ncbi:hypothetical protein GH714_008663 [Hevea brasiliensis]|uniref:Uncharacterized protein n=1 Tax=Hevea brasiliensis TaxID=3981 RepID=A0A6A6NCT9_HEVBR|nr:hypothetical protein GH714_008663 [Hevea brasiliensis]
MAVDHEQNTSSSQPAESIILQNMSHRSSISDSSCNYPTLSAILAMDSVARVSALKKRISLAETMSTLSKHDCVWLFALCAAVDTPLDADTSAALRSLLRKCASLRAAKSELDDEVIMLNILATISGAVGSLCLFIEGYLSQDALATVKELLLDSTGGDLQLFAPGLMRSNSTVARVE